MLPIIVLGVIIVLKRIRYSVSSRVLLAFVLVYPVGDIIYEAMGPHTLRSAPGMCSLIMLGSVGAVTAAKWLYERNRIIAKALIVIFAGAIIFFNARYLPRFFGEYNRDPGIYGPLNVDFIEACRWLKPRYKDFDIVFCNASGMNMPYIISLVILEYKPEQWFDDPKLMSRIMEWEDYKFYGKIHFWEGSQNDIRQLLSGEIKSGKYRSGHILFICRPGDVEFSDPQHEIVKRIYTPDGEEVMWLCIL
jgi:esterase/lipase superfamily enzyme